MDVADAPAASPVVRLAPVSERERIVTLDVLRGIALLGVVIANVWLWFSGLAFRFPDYREQLLQFGILRGQPLLELLDVGGLEPGFLAGRCGGLVVPGPPATIRDFQVRHGR